MTRFCVTTPMHYASRFAYWPRSWESSQTDEGKTLLEYVVHLAPDSGLESKSYRQMKHLKAVDTTPWAPTLDPIKEYDCAYVRKILDCYWVLHQLRPCTDGLGGRVELGGTTFCACASGEQLTVHRATEQRLTANFS
jgi:hypothetical protein